MEIVCSKLFWNGLKCYRAFLQIGYLSCELWPRHTAHELPIATIASTLIFVLIAAAIKGLTVGRALDDFGFLSLYKANTNKSYILGINIPCHPKNLISVTSGFPWTPTSNPQYLMVTLTVPNCDLFWYNYKTLLKKIAEQCNDFF